MRLAHLDILFDSQRVLLTGSKGGPDDIEPGAGR
jgi:hypothetical protein